MSQPTKELSHHKFYLTCNIFSGGMINGAAISKGTVCLQIGTSQEKKRKCYLKNQMRQSQLQFQVKRVFVCHLC